MNYQNSQQLTIQQALSRAKKAAKKGNIANAVELYTAILQQQPNHPIAKKALRKLQKSLPQNQSVETETSSPFQDQIDSLVNLYQSGQMTETEQACRELLQAYPQSVFIMNVLGATLSVQGKLQEAVQTYDRAIQLKPDFSEGYNNRGNALGQLKKLEEALKSYGKAIQLRPDYAEAHYNMALVFQAQSKFEEALVANKKALRIKPDYAEAYYNMALVFQAQGNHEEALVANKKALLIKPDFAEAHNNMGIAFQAKGEFDDAIAAYNKALLIKPDYAEAHYNKCSLREYEYSDPQIVQMEKLYAGTNISDEDRCHLCFALAKSSEDLGNLEEAFRYLKEGNALRKKNLNYDIVQDEEIFSKIKETANSFKNFSFDASGDENIPIPIMILGMPRSGTTLVEQIISNHSKVTAAGELNFLKMFGSPLAEGKVEVSEDELRTLRNQYLNEIKKLSVGRPFVTDKMPSNFFYIGLICSAFPDARIVHVRRNAAATCWSNFKQYFSFNGVGYCYSLRDVVRYYQMYQELMLFWDKHYPEKIYHLDYEQLTAEQESETKKLIQYLGIDWEDACLFPEENKRPVYTASNLQARKKVYKGSSEEWKKFDKHLDSAFDELPN